MHGRVLYIFPLQRQNNGARNFRTSSERHVASALLLYKYKTIGGLRE